jgi:hypothetical protein
MSVSPNSSSSSSSLRQRDLHANVERQTLALGAARERTLCADSFARERRLERAVGAWENEGGAVAGDGPSATTGRPAKLSTLRLTADLFRDDTLWGAVIVNGLLLLLAGAGLAVWLTH